MPVSNDVRRNDEETENLKLRIVDETDRLGRLQKDRAELSGQIESTLRRLYGMCSALKEADGAPVPDKCPSADKADWLICLLQTKYENVIRSGGITGRRDVDGTKGDVRACVRARATGGYAVSVNSTRFPVVLGRGGTVVAG